MVEDIRKGLDDYLAWLRGKSSLRQIEDWVEITTPYLDRHNDYIQIYAKRANGGYLMDNNRYSGKTNTQAVWLLTSEPQNQIGRDGQCGRGVWHVSVSFPGSVVEDAALAWLETLGYAVLHSPEVAVGQHATERCDPNYCDVVLEQRMRQALVRLHPGLPLVQDAFRKLTRAAAASLVERHRGARRDTLLPKLISGNKRVKDPARFVDRVDGVDIGGRDQP